MKDAVYELIINSPHLFVVRRDLIGRFTYINPSFAKRFAFLSQDLIGEIFDLTVYPRDIEKLNNALSRCITHPEETLTLKIRKKKENYDFWWIQWEISAVKDENDNVVEVLFIGHDITESETNSLRVLEYAKKANTILGGITDGFYTVNHLWEITRVNKVFERTLGMKSGDIVGKKMWDIFPKNEQYTYQIPFRKTMNEKQTSRFDAFFNGKWMSITAYSSLEGITVFLQDITERKKQEEELRENIEKLGNAQKVLQKALSEENKLSMIVQNTNDIVVLTDIHGKITWINEAFTRVTGYALAEVIGKKPGHILQGKETDAQTVASISQDIKAYKEIKTEIINYSKSGEKYWIGMHIQPIFDGENSLSGFMAIQSVITERKEHEQKILHRNELLEEIAFIQAHEVRRPVANILGLINLIRGEEDPYTEIITTYINSLDVAAKDLDDVIHRIVFKTNEAH